MSSAETVVPPTRVAPKMIPPPGSILVIDVGGTHVKVQSEANIQRTPQPAPPLVEPSVDPPSETAETAEAAPENVDPNAPLKIVSGETLTPQGMVDQIRAAVKWPFSAISMGFPGPVLHGRPVAEPHNLACGWMGFDFEKAFECPVKIVNDAAMQALGSYEGGRMLFLGLGTGLGSTMIVDGILEPLELAHLPYKKHKTYEDYVGLRGMKRLGKKKWRHEVADVVERLRAALLPEYVVLGGGNAKFMKELADGVRLGNNENAYLGGVRLWRGTVSGPASENFSQTSPTPEKAPAGSALISDSSYSFRVG